MTRDLPLRGLRIVVTRPRGQGKGLASALRTAGAEPLIFPLIRVGPAPGTTEAHDAVERIRGYDWVVFTSSNGARAFANALAAQEKDASAIGSTRICAVGAATAAAVREWGGAVALVPETQTGEGVAEALLAAGPGRRVLLARAAHGRAVIPERLARAGVSVDDVAFYQTLADGEGAAALQAEMRTGSVDVVTFTSGSTVRAFATGVGGALGRALTASIGPATSAELRASGLPVDIEASVHSGEGLVQALIARMGNAA